MDEIVKIRYAPSAYVVDGYIKERSLKQRLFTRPWRPLQKFERVEQPMVYVVEIEATKEMVALVSYETYEKLIRDGMEDLEWNG